MLNNIYNYILDQATVYMSGFIGAFWGALTLFVGIRSFLLSREQNAFKEAGKIE